MSAKPDHRDLGKATWIFPPDQKTAPRLACPRFLFFLQPLFHIIRCLSSFQMFNYLFSWTYLLPWVIGLMSGGTRDNRTPKSSSSPCQKRLPYIYDKDYHEIIRSPFFPAGSPRPLSPIKSKSHTPPTSRTSPKRSAAHSEPSLSPPKLPETMPGIHAPDMEPDLQSVFSDFDGRSDHPTPDFTYIILHQPTNRALSIIKGEPTLHRVPEPIPGVSHPALLEGKTNWHWECVETDNWLSFRNAATGRFLGHDADGNESEGRDANPRWGNFRCLSTQPGPSEKFAFLSLESGEMAPSVMLSEGEVDGFEAFGQEEDDDEENEEDEECGAAEGDIEDLGDGEKGEVGPEPQSQASALYSLLVQPQKSTSCDLHQIAGCPDCATGIRKLVKVQVKPESWAEGSEVQVVWDADEDAGTVWRFVKVVPPEKESVESRRRLGLEG